MFIPENRRLKFLFNSVRLFSSFQMSAIILMTRARGDSQLKIALVANSIVFRDNQWGVQNIFSEKNYEFNRSVALYFWKRQNSFRQYYFRRIRRNIFRSWAANKTWRQWCGQFFKVLSQNQPHDCRPIQTQSISELSEILKPNCLLLNETSGTD